MKINCNIASISLIVAVMFALLSQGEPSKYETAHYCIYSSATAEQTRKATCVAEGFYLTYSQFLQDIGVEGKSTTKHALRIYRDSKEIKCEIPKLKWAQCAYFATARCAHVYIDVNKSNPYHWMTHECTHQLNKEVANFKLKLWLEEGLATYFASSMIINARPKLGTLDNNTYPAFQSALIATNGDFATDRENKSIIPLRTIISDNSKKTPSDNFNLYYLHYWTLTHFIFHAEEGKYRRNLSKLLLNGNNVEEFERWIGPITEIEPQWYSYVIELKARIKNTHTPRVEIDPGKIPAGFKKFL